MWSTYTKIKTSKLAEVVSLPQNLAILRKKAEIGKYLIIKIYEMVYVPK